jgi:hypothetical protein
MQYKKNILKNNKSHLLKMTISEPPTAADTTSMVKAAMQLHIKP